MKHKSEQCSEICYSGQSTCPRFPTESRRRVASAGRSLIRGCIVRSMARASIQWCSIHLAELNTRHEHTTSDAALRAPVGWGKQDEGNDVHLRVESTFPRTCLDMFQRELASSICKGWICWRYLLANPQVVTHSLVVK